VTVTGVSVGNGPKVKRKPGAPQIVIQYSGAVNASGAASLANYQLSTIAMGKRRPAKPIALAGAAYNSVAHSVTLSLRKRPVGRLSGQLVIVANGVTDSQGRPIDGNRDGQPGGNYQGNV
jgi:hypothetical protein